MTNQGATARHQPEDGWWDAVYEGPAGTLPDTPGAVAGEGSVDDWFATAAGMIGPQRDGSQPVQAAPEGAPGPADVPGRPGTADRAEGGRAGTGGGTPGRPRSTQRTPEEVSGATAGEGPGAAAPLRAEKPTDNPADNPADEPAGRPTDGSTDRVTEGSAEKPVEELERAGTPARPEEDSLDDWFDTAVGVIGGRRASDIAPAPAPPPTVAPFPAAAPLPTPAPPTQSGPVTAVSGAARTEVDATHLFPAPSWAPDAASGRAPSPVVSSTGPVEDLRTVTLAEPVPEPEPVPEAEPVPDAVPVLEALPEPVAGPAPASAPEPVAVPAPEPAPPLVVRPSARAAFAEPVPPVPHIGERPPTYGPEPTAVPPADPQDLGVIVPDTALEGAQYGASTLRAVSVRGDSARYRGEPRRDSLLVTRFGDGPDGLLLAALGGFGRVDGQPAPPAGEITAATAEACRQLAAAIGRSRAELSADLRDGARDRLRYGLQRLATSASAPLRAVAGPASAPPPERADPAAPVPGGDAPDLSQPGSLHCLLISLDPEASYRAAFGIGPGGLYLLRSGHWIDAYGARLLHHPDGRPPVPEAAAPEPRPFRFRLVPATPGDILLLCTPGLAGPIAEEPAVAHFLASHWAHPHPPGTVDFLRQVQVRAKGYADDRTAAAVWTE